MDYFDDRTEYYERLLQKIRETELNGLKVVEIRIRPEKIGFLVSHSPQEYIVLRENGEITFRGIPLVQKDLSKDIVCELQTENPQ